MFPLGFHVGPSFPLFGCFPPFYTCTYWSRWACFVFGQRSNPSPWRDVRCPVDFFGLPLQANQWRRQMETVQMWRAEESAHLYPQHSQNPQARSSNQDFQLWDGISPCYHKSTARSPDVTMSETACYQTTSNTFSCSVRGIGLFWSVERVQGALHWFYTSRPGYSSFVEAVYTFTVRWVCGVRCVGFE